MALLMNISTQVCSNGTKVYLERSIKETFVAKLLERVRSLKIGDPFREDTQVGALINQEHMEKVLGYVRGAKEQVSSLAAFIC